MSTTPRRNKDDGAATVGQKVDALRPERVRGFRLRFVGGPQQGDEWVAKENRCVIGSHDSNDVVIKDPPVSRFHCEIVIDQKGARLNDLDSTNGTVVDGLPVIACWLRSGSVIRLGTTALRFEFVAESIALQVSERTSFGSLVGCSPAMRMTFALLERAAATDATVLLEGETGTGKQGASEAIHGESSRADGPFVTIDCGSLPATLLDSELFGHEPGAFTGAGGRRIGAFEEASGGTVFLDEIGELPADLQPKLLHALEQREVRRVGSNTYVPINVRVIAATNRDLRTEVNAGRFREDLYYRLAVVKVRMPPLRGRPEDLPPLVEAILRQLDAPEEATAKLTTREFLSGLARASWAGNVRELRNYLQRCLVFDQAVPMPGEEPHGEGSGLTVDPSRPWHAERARVIAEFERTYLEQLLAAHDGSVTAAARAAQLDRVYVYKLLRRHGLKPGSKS